MKVLVVDFGIVFGGQEIYSCSLYNNLQASGVQWFRYGTISEEGNLDLSQVCTFFNMRNHARQIDFLATDFDAVHFNGNKALQVSFFCKTQKPKIATKHLPFSKPNQHKLKAIILKWTYLLVLKKIDSIICIAPVTFREIGLPQTIYIPNGVSSKMVESIRLNRRDTDIRFCYVARLTDEKGIIIFLSAILILVSELKGRCFSVEICGTGPLEASCRSFISNHGLGEFVRFRGFVSDTAPVYSAAHVCVLPSLHEGMPLNILEAFSAAVPVVSFNIENVNEVVEHGRNGVLVDSKSFSPRSLALELKKLIDNPKQIEILAKNALEDYYNKYTSNKMVEQTLEVFKRVCFSRD